MQQNSVVQPLGKFPRSYDVLKAWKNFAKALLCIAAILLTATGFSSSASAQTKSLKLYYLHTGERVTIAFKKDGKYIPSGLKKINWALRDWRRNEPTKMDPKLLDLIWEVYRRSGSHKFIHVISGYRSLASNNLLRKRGRGVAKHSQHTKGKAMDFFLPDVPLKKLREIGLKLQVGGVGYYPTSGSPFVHMDTGNVRHWPRMSRKQLVKLFPNGKTLHVPADGKPLAHYEQAMASYKKRKSKGTLVPEPKAAKKQFSFAKKAKLFSKDDEAEDARGGGIGVATLPRTVKTTRKVTARAPKPTAAIVPTTPPTPQTPVEPPVVPAETVIATRETDRFVFPANIPVPVVAPRIQPEPAKQVEIAALEPKTPAEPEPGVNPSNDNLDQASQEPLVNENEVTKDDNTQLASLNLPVPAQRPDFGAILADTTNGEANQTNELAMVETPKSSPSTQPSKGQQIASLSPQEIEDLRTEVLATIPVSQREKPLDTPKTTATIAPLPVEDLTTAKPVDQSAIVEPVNEIAKLKTNQQPEKSADTTITALQPQPVETNQNSPSLPIPQPNPIVTASIDNTQQQQIIETVEPKQTIGIEPGVKSSGEFAVPSKNPVAPVLVASLEPETVTPANSIAANLPIPTPNPRAKLLMASLETQVTPAIQATPAAQAVEQVQESQLASRTISLDKYSAPQENSNTIGQWALSNQTTIRDLADVQAPAYGRNAIRKISGTILVQSFIAQPFGPGQNNFKGKAVTAMNFARLQLDQ